MEMLRLGLFDVAGIVLIPPNETIRAQRELAELAFQWAWVTVIEWTLVIEMSEIIENATKFETSMNLTILRFLAYFDISKRKITEKKRSSNKSSVIEKINRVSDSFYSWRSTQGSLGSAGPSRDL